MEKLIKSDGIKIILSSNITPVNQAAATVAEQYEAYFHIVSSWTDEASPDGSFAGFIGGMDLRWSTDMFESAADSGLVAVGGAQAMDPADVPKKFAVMTENTPDGVGFGDATKAGLEAAGFEVVSYEKFVEGNKDFSSIILKFKEAGVEGVVTLIAPSDGITFVKQMKEANWSPKYIFGYKGFWPVDFYNGLGADADYICYDGFWSETLPYPYAARNWERPSRLITTAPPPIASASITPACRSWRPPSRGPACSNPAPSGIRSSTAASPARPWATSSTTTKASPTSRSSRSNGHRAGSAWSSTPTEVATGKTVTFVPWEER